jgi:predicted nucleic acid-binding protein
VSHPRGRPPHPRGVYSYEDLLLPCPADALVDTSFVVEAVIPSQPGHAAATRYLKRLAEAETILFFNRLLDLELAEAAFKIALKERFGPRDWQRRRSDGRARRRAGRLMSEAAEAWEEMLLYFSGARIELDAVAAGVPQLMRQFGLASYDAVHAATAIHTGVAAIITRDTDFAALPQGTATIFTDSGRVATCRKRRGG